MAKQSRVIKNISFRKHKKLKTDNKKNCRGLRLTYHCLREERHSISKFKVLNLDLRAESERNKKALAPGKRFDQQ